MSMIESRDFLLSRLDRNFVLFFAAILKIRSSAAALCGIVRKKSAIFASFGKEVLELPQTISMGWYICSSDTFDQ